jgi:hypothetical protein
MPIQFEVSKGTLKEVAQSCLEAKKLARTVENMADSMMPLSNTEETTELLRQISDSQAIAIKAINTIYNAIAREAMKE